MKHIEHIVGYMRFKARLDNLDVRINEAEINEYAKSRDWNPFVYYCLNKGVFEPFDPSKHGWKYHSPVMPYIGFSSDGLPRCESIGLTYWTDDGIPMAVSETINLYYGKHNLLELSDLGETDKELLNFCPSVDYYSYKMRLSMKVYRDYLEHYP